MELATEKPDRNKYEREDESNEQEQTEQSLHLKLQETQQMLAQLKEWGVHPEPEIERERLLLEADFQKKLDDLRKRLEGATLSDESEKQIHQHLVDDIVVFRKKVLKRHELLQKLQDELTSKSGYLDPVQAAAEQSGSVDEFQGRLRRARQERDGDDPAIKVIKRAEKNLSKIKAKYGDYKVKKDLGQLGGDVKIAGLTEMNSSGGGDVTIDADHLAEVTTEAGADEVNQTLVHEDVHTQQTRFDSGAQGVVVVDPHTREKMTEEDLHEGGAVHGTKHMKGRDVTKLAAVYDKGSKFYKRNDSTTIDAHVKKGRQHSGDRVHLQAALVRDAGITDSEQLQDIARKADLTEAEQVDFMAQAQSTEETADDIAQAA